jgi:hypothetical protein
LPSVPPYVALVMLLGLAVGVFCNLLYLVEPGRDGWCCLPRSTTRHTWPFSVARGDRQVHCDSSGHCGRQDARADSLRAGLQPFTCGEVVAATRCAGTPHLLLWHSAVVALARLSDPHRELPVGGSQSSQRPAGPVNGRTWVVLGRDVSTGDSTRRALLTAASSALCALQALAGGPRRG